jgi:hypothetical protein
MAKCRFSDSLRFAAVVQDNMRAAHIPIDRNWVHEVSFLAPASTERGAIGAREDGLLTAALFKRIYISYARPFRDLRTPVNGITETPARTG